jgi:GntR family transcriptional regulator/MocR family aminotransferase
MIKGILFDKDGTLIDFSLWRNAGINVIETILKEYNIEDGKLNIDLQRAIGIKEKGVEPFGALAYGSHEDVAHELHTVLKKHIEIADNDFPIDRLRKSDAKVIYISPSHQYPLGTIMPVNKRMELLDWAYKKNGIIIEDDYDSMIRYGGMPIPSLQGLDKNDCVVYLGSFSKMLLPSLRISFMVIPKKLLPKYNEIKDRYTQSTSKIDQIVLAHFMKDGHMVKHLRKIKRIYKKKNSLLIANLKSLFTDKIEIISSDSGLHMVCEAKTKKDEAQIIKDAQNSRILINIIGCDNNKIMFSLNYSGINLNDIQDFTLLLGKVLFDAYA